MKRIIAALIAGGGLAASAVAMAMLTPTGVTRTDLQRHDLSFEGHEAVQARIDIAPGAVAPWHRHPGEEVIYILEGTLEYQLEGSKPVTLAAGDVLFVPAGIAHTARNRTDSNGAELATYVVEKGKPLLESVEAPAVRSEAK
jgi:quercetin dioxygenase-like cupin family protein